MKAIIQVDALDFGDAALLARPLLQKRDWGDSARGGFLRELVNLPEAVIRSAVEAIPEERKRELLSAWVREKKPGLLEMANGLLEEKQLGIHVSNLALSRDLTLALAIDRIDMKKLLDKIRGGSGMGRMPKALALGLVRTFSGDQKAGLVLQLINGASDQIAGAVENLALKKGLHVKIRSIYALEDKK